MSIDTYKVLGYRMDCTEEMYHSSLKCVEQMKEYGCYGWDEFIEADAEKAKRLEKLGFIPFTDAREVMNDKNNYITFLDDGICSSSAWLVYAEKMTYSDGEEDDFLNSKLASMPVPDEIAAKMRKVYEVLFEQPESESLKKAIHYQEIYYYF